MKLSTSLSLLALPLLCLAAEVPVYHRVVRNFGLTPDFTLRGTIKLDDNGSISYEAAESSQNAFTEEWLHEDFRYQVALGSDRVPQDKWTFTTTTSV